MDSIWQTPAFKPTNKNQSVLKLSERYTEESRTRTRTQVPKPGTQLPIFNYYFILQGVSFIMASSYLNLTKSSYFSFLQRPNPMESFIAGSTSGAISCFLFQPLDLIKTKLQAQVSTATSLQQAIVDGRLAPKHNYRYLCYITLYKIFRGINRAQMFKI